MDKRLGGENLNEIRSQVRTNEELSNNIKEVFKVVMSLSVEGVFPNIDELFNILDIRSKCRELTMPLALVLSVMSKGIRDGDQAVLKLFYEISRDMFGFDNDEGTGFGQLLSAIKCIRINCEKKS